MSLHQGASISNFAPVILESHPSSAPLVPVVIGLTELAGRITTGTILPATSDDNSSCFSLELCALAPSPRSCENGMVAVLFPAFLGLLIQHVGKPLAEILDNASVHKAKADQPILKLGAKGPQALLPAALQPETEPHREAVVQDEVHLDGVHGPRRHVAGR